MPIICRHKIGNRTYRKKCEKTTLFWHKTASLALGNSPGVYLMFTNQGATEPIKQRLQNKNWSYKKKIKFVN